MISSNCVHFSIECLSFRYQIMLSTFHLKLFLLIEELVHDHFCLVQSSKILRKKSFGNGQFHFVYYNTYIIIKLTYKFIIWKFLYTFP